ncbi:MAG: DNA repair protein RecN [Gammaproteobacteria bacterium]
MRPAVLKALTIRDFALVARLEIAFDQGLTVITGESGAGKSILLGALGLVLGDRAAADTVRPGAERADITAEFDLSGCPDSLALLAGQDLTDSDQPARCLVRRIVGADGRSRAFINGTPATLQTLRELCAGLIDIHGQHEHARLLAREVQLALLDDFGVPQDLRADCRAAHRQWQRADEAARELTAQLAARADRAALLEYQLGELDALGLADGDYERIDAHHRRLGQARALREAASAVLELLAEHSPIGAALRRLDGLDDHHTRLDAARETLRAAADLVDDAIHDLRAYDDTLDVDPEVFADLDRQLAAVLDLARKHRVPAAELVRHAEGLRAELSAQGSDRTDLDRLRATANTERDRFASLAARIRDERRAAASGFETAVGACMNTLGIRGGALHVQFSEAENETGIDAVEFFVTTNPKYPPGPLGRIASGGERARISLAIQVAAAARSALPCLVLDEADVGVGGTTADVVGRLLRALAQHTQVLCVTHAPQVAALGHHHLKVQKDAAQDTQIEPLSGDARVEELARMLAGADVNERARDYARTLLHDAARAPLH